MSRPWDEWIPGVLNESQVQRLRGQGYIRLADDVEIDGSAFDLSVSGRALEMKKGSVKPSAAAADYGGMVQREGLALPFRPFRGLFHLRKKHTYVFQLRESIDKRLADAGFHGQATTKSSIGRLDVLTRLIVNGMDSYEGFTDAGLQRGDGQMYLEVTPITFPIVLRVGTCLSQLRLFYGDPHDVEMRGGQLFRAAFPGCEKSEGSLSVDLGNAQVGGICASAFCASERAPELRIDKGERSLDPHRFWKLKRSEMGRLTIGKDRFYILRSKEKIALPDGVAVYCRASDETIGEMRIHYAGFVHPLFGRERTDGSTGTPLIFEVRGHQVNVTLTDGERMASLIFYRMSEHCKGQVSSRSRRGGGAPVKGAQNYQDQGLQLSKFFKPWPARLKEFGDGNVRPA